MNMRKPKSNAKKSKAKKPSATTQKPKIKVPWFLWTGLAVFLLILAYLLPFVQTNRYSFDVDLEQEQFVDQASNQRKSQPTTLHLPSLDLTLPIDATNIEDGEWEVPEEAVGHLAISSRPGENNNVVMYAHNRPGLFGQLHQLEPDNLIIVEAQDGSEHIYQVFSKRITTPDDVAVVLPTESEQLTLYTCDGWLDRDRLVVKARPFGD